MSWLNQIFSPWTISPMQSSGVLEEGYVDTTYKVSKRRRSFNFHDFDGNYSDSNEENDAVSTGPEISNWLEEEEEDCVTSNPLYEDNPIFKDPFFLKKDMIDLFKCLSEVVDLNFLSLEFYKQKDLLNSLVIKSFEPGDIIVKEGNQAGEFFIIISLPPGASDPEVEVIREVDGAEKTFTVLSRGSYFGQKYLTTNRLFPRNATIRAITFGHVACVYPVDFDKWIHFRCILIMNEVPIMKLISKSNQISLYSDLQHDTFQDGDYIIRQGDRGDTFYVILEGSAEILDEGGEEVRLLTRIYDGDFFGEMALVTDKPRVASVKAVGQTVCLSLTVASFRSLLHEEEAFHVLVDSAMQERFMHRSQRLINGICHMDKLHRAERSSGSNLSQLLFPPSKRHNSSSKRVVCTTKAVIHRLSSGCTVVNDYILLREIGRGACAEVFQCLHQISRQEFAMKVIARQDGDDHLDEIGIMSLLAHRNIVRLYEAIDDPSSKYVFLVLEHVASGSLLPDKEITDPLRHDRVWMYFRDMCRGLAHMHSVGVVHLDIKPSNMLLSADDAVKISDFGSSALAASRSPRVMGTPAYMAPELFSTACEASGMPAGDLDLFLLDIWSLGISLYAMVVGHLSWMADNEIGLGHQLLRAELSFPDVYLDPHLHHLLKSMLEKDTTKRLRLHEVVSHEWVTKEGSDILIVDDNDDEDASDS